MNSKSLIVEYQAPVAAPADRKRRAAYYMAKAKAKNTIRAYQGAFRHFVAWCNPRGHEPLPPMPITPQGLAAYTDVVTDYVIDLADQKLSFSTIQLRLTALSQANRMSGRPSISTRTEPLHTVWEGIQRDLSTAQHGKAPILTEDIRRMISAMPDTLLGVRDRTLLLLGFSGAFRRSELVSLNVEDLEVVRDGIIVTLRRSKTDKTGKGTQKGIPYGSNPLTCPVRSMQEWLEASAIKSGPLFRYVNRHGQIPDRVRAKNGKYQDNRLSDHSVAKVVKRWATAAGYDAEQVKRFSGHSLRAGLATAAAQAGAEEGEIKNQTGHRSSAMVQRYIRRGTLFTRNVASKVGL